MLQVLLLGLAGSLLGVALARRPSPRCRRARRQPRRRCWHVEYGVTASAALQGIGDRRCWCRCCSRSCRCCEVRHVKPSLLLRHDIPPRRAIDWVEMERHRVLVAAALVARRRLAGGLAARRPDAVAAALSRRRSSCIWPAWRWCARCSRCATSRSFALRQAVLHIARPGQPDARHPARRRPRRVLHPRRADAAGEPARGVLDADRRGRAGHVPDRHPGGSGGRACRVHRSSRTARGAAERHPGAARARHRRPRARGRTSKPTSRSAAAARWRANTRSPIAPQLERERESCSQGKWWDASRRPARRRCRSRRACRSASASTSATDAVRRAGADDHRRA